MYAEVTTSNGMQPVHTGEILRDELDELGMSSSAFTTELAVPTNRVISILNGQRSITADTALRLSRYFGTSPELWLNLQKTFELHQAARKSGKYIAERVKPREVAHSAAKD